MCKIKKCPTVILAMAATILTSTLTASKVSASTLAYTGRLWGADRYETSAKIAKSAWESSEYAIVASGEGYADALCAAPLAKIKNAPILLTNKNELNRHTLTELRRLKVKNVYIVGGEASISKEVENNIKYLTGAETERLSGKDRYETSVKIAEKLPQTNKIILTSGEGYADALSAAPVAAIKAIPIILTKSNELPTVTRNYIDDSKITSAYVIGGQASVSDTVKNSVSNAQRIYGQDRFETNAEVIRAFALDFEFNNAYVALASGSTGKEFADALSGSALAGKKSAPVILTGKKLNGATKKIVDEMLFPTSNITVLGGNNNVSDELIDSMRVNVSEYFGTKNEVYTKNVQGNAVITDKNITLQDMKIEGNLYVQGKDSKLSNVNVTGTIYIDHGRDGECVLDKVDAKNIVVLSGEPDKDSVQLKNVYANNLNVLSNSIVRIVSQGTTEIKNTEVASNAIIENRGGNFGNIKIPKSPKYKDIEFKGTFLDPIIVEGQAEIKAPNAGNIPRIKVRTDKNEEILFDGKFNVIEVYTETDIKITRESTATVRAESSEAKVGAKVSVPLKANVSIEGLRKNNITRYDN
ncbi:cell wall-binding repeat-containing protein [Clostridium lundense]|uniref:cell wall-binding repeat-containing protein n=1 Tax=Clostridium lundense TaxID=319475 RepID=UPI000687B77B|nr:cell wall-binding repeat-containing protein [Clostridium lundense]